MTVRMILMACSHGGVVGAWSAAVNRAVEGDLDINTDGSISGLGRTGASKWYNPTGGTPGDNFYVKFAKTGDAWDAGLTEGTVYALTSNRTVGWTEGPGDKVATLTVSIYTDSGGTNLVGTGTVDVFVTTT